MARDLVTPLVPTMTKTLSRTMTKEEHELLLFYSSALWYSTLVSNKQQTPLCLMLLNEYRLNEITPFIISLLYGLKGRREHLVSWGADLRESKQRCFFKIAVNKDWIVADVLLGRVSEGNGCIDRIRAGGERTDSTFWASFYKMIDLEQAFNWDENVA